MNRVAELKREIRADDFKHDSYGTSMEWLGAIADHLTESGLQSSIPGSWGYSAPFGVADDHKERYSFEVVAELFPISEGMPLKEIIAAESELIEVGNLLDRLIDMHRANGTDY